MMQYINTLHIYFKHTLFIVITSENVLVHLKCTHHNLKGRCSAANTHCFEPSVLFNSCKSCQNWRKMEVLPMFPQFGQLRAKSPTCKKCQRLRKAFEKYLFQWWLRENLLSCKPTIFSHSYLKNILFWDQWGHGQTSEKLGKMDAFPIFATNYHHQGTIPVLGNDGYPCKT
jgi:hypothetical protein